MSKKNGRKPEAHKEPTDEKQTWDKRWQNVRAAYSNIPKTFALVWQSNRSGTVAMAVLTLFSAILPASQAWVGKLIVDAVVNALDAGMTPQEGLQVALPFLVVEFVLLTCSAALNQARSLLEHILHTRMKNTVNTTIMRKAISLDLNHFEQADFYDKLKNARREADHRTLVIVNIGFLTIQNIITLLSFAVVLFSFKPIIALILFGTTMPAFIAQTKFSKLHFRMLTWRAPEFRRMEYMEYLLTVDSSVKEVKLFGLGEPFLKRHQDVFWEVTKEDEALAKRRSFYSVLLGMLGTMSYYGAYAWIVWITISGSITLGTMILYMTVFRQSQAIFQELFHNLGRLYESGLFMDNLFSFLTIESQMKTTNNHRVPRPLKRGIEFRNVSFRYPEQQEWVIRNLNLHIGAGEALAIVGSNGAGKTTLIKLLSRLYDPTEGQILLDGRDLHEYDANDLRANIGVIFQDFVHYYATAGENVGFGQIDALEDEPRLMSAAARGGADEVIESLPDSYGTMLGRWFKEGHELSGGQWQKIALARAFMRDSQVLILDEPTAALDAEREHEIFLRFRELTAGKTAVLISHRFSTVRMADRIAVMKHGQLAEIGTHDELLALNGEYAHLFNLQAAGYR